MMASRNKLPLNFFGLYGWKFNTVDNNLLSHFLLLNSFPDCLALRITEPRSTPPLIHTTSLSSQQISQFEFCVISNFGRGVYKIFALLRRYAALICS